MKAVQNGAFLIQLGSEGLLKQPVATGPSQLLARENLLRSGLEIPSLILGENLAAAIERDMTFQTPGWDIDPESVPQNYSPPPPRNHPKIATTRGPDSLMSGTIRV